MAYQVFRFTPSEEYGEHAPGGYPRGPITNEWLEAKVRELQHTEEPLTLEQLTSRIASFKRVDGDPLYPLTAKARKDIGTPEPVEQPTRSIQELALAEQATAPPPPEAATAPEDTPTPSFEGTPPQAPPEGATAPHGGTGSRRTS